MFFQLLVCMSFKVECIAAYCLADADPLPLLSAMMR
jgi:hypothetical protein